MPTHKKRCQRTHNTHTCQRLNKLQLACRKLSCCARGQRCNLKTRPEALFECEHCGDAFAEAGSGRGSLKHLRVHLRVGPTTRPTRVSRVAGGAYINKHSRALTARRRGCHGAAAQRSNSTAFSSRRTFPGGSPLRSHASLAASLPQPLPLRGWEANLQE